MQNSPELVQLKAAISEELRGNINAKNTALRLIDEYAATQKSYLRMGKVKVGDFLQKNRGPVVPIGMNGVLILELDDVQPENPKKS